MDLKNDDSHKKELEIQYYSASLNGWLNTRLEETKTFITLSTGGIGVLLIFFPNIPNNNDTLIYCYFASIILFIISVASFTATFGVNAKYLVEKINKNKKEENTNSIKNNILAFFGIKKSGDILNLLSFLGKSAFSLAVLISCFLPAYLKFHPDESDSSELNLNKKVLDLEKKIESLAKELNNKKG